MSKVLLKYFITKFLKKLCGYGIYLLLFWNFIKSFEEVEFFKNIDTSIFTPLILTSLIIPSLIVKILPFIIFISSMWYIRLRNSKELLTLKVFGFSNLKFFYSCFHLLY